MALLDIVFSEGDPQNFVMTMHRGNIGSVTEILTESNSNAGEPVNELPAIVNTSQTVAYTWVG